MQGCVRVLKPGATLAAAWRRGVAGFFCVVRLPFFRHCARTRSSIFASSRRGKVMLIFGVARREATRQIGDYHPEGVGGVARFAGNDAFHGRSSRVRSNRPVCAACVQPCAQVRFGVRYAKKPAARRMGVNGMRIPEIPQRPARFFQLLDKIHAVHSGYYDHRWCTSHTVAAAPSRSTPVTRSFSSVAFRHILDAYRRPPLGANPPQFPDVDLIPKPSEG